MVISLSVRFLVGIVFLVGVFGCTSSSKKLVTYEKIERGQWSGKITIENKKNGEENSIDFDAVADRKLGVRMELSAILGTHVGSLAMNEKQIRFFVTRAKHFYYGAATAESLIPLLGAPVDPHLFYTVFFDEPPRDSRWKCDYNNLEQPVRCESEEFRTEVRWKSRQGEQKVIEITHPLFGLKLKVKKFQPKDQLNKKVFKLTKPKGFRVFRIVTQKKRTDTKQ